MSHVTVPPAAGQGPPPGPIVPAVAPTRSKAKPLTAGQWVKKYLIEPVASLRVTVVLFSLAIFLVFVGTLAQAEAGIWTVVDKYFRTGLAWIPWQAFVKFGQVFLGFSPDAYVAGSFPYPGGWLLGGLLLANLLAAHALRFRFTFKDVFLLPGFVLSVALLTLSEANHSDALLMWCGLLVLMATIAGLIPLHGKRSGVLVLHAGLIVMMMSELITGKYAVEGSMSIGGHETTNFVDNNREYELAIVDRTNPRIDDVVVIPQPMLREGSTIRHKDLPFDVVVERYMTNSGLVDATKWDGKNPATAGDGKRFVARPKAEVAGADTEGAIDIAAAYLTFKHKETGKALGTYLVSLQFYANLSRRQLPDLYQRVESDGRRYDVQLRPKRTYRPFSIHLLEFRHDRFLGTNRPKNFSSLVRLVEKEPGTGKVLEDREVKISMNQPLRYGGETFYQQSFFPDDSGTVLQVVRNPGWLMPYISCAMVALGMIIHFGLHLLAFLRRRAVV